MPRNLRPDDPEGLRQLKAEFFKALAHPLRIRILELLRDSGPLSVGALTELVGVPASSISQQLAVLRARGIVVSTRHPSGTMPPASPLLQGTLDLIVLQLLRAEPTNGYDLTLRIQAVSRDVLQVNAGSLYPALYRLEERGLIKAHWEETPKGRRAKVY